MPFHKKVKKFVKKVIPKEIAPFVAPVAGMALGPIAGGFLGGIGGTLAAKGGIGAALGKVLSNQMVSQGLGRALVDVGTQALTSDRISPASALLSGGLGALSGYQPNVVGPEGPLKLTGLQKAGLKLRDLGRVGNLGDDFDLLAAAKMANVGGTLKAADDELDAQKERAKQLAMESAAFRTGDNAERRQSIISAMLAAGFDRTEAESAAAEEGYAMGGRVGFDMGGMPERGGGANEEAMADMMMNMESDEFYVDEEGNLRRIPKKRPRQNTRPGMNEEMMFDLMRRMDLNRMGRQDGGIMMAMSDPDPMAERSDMLENLALKYFGKPLDKLSDDEVIELQDLMDDMPLKLNKGGKVPGLPAGRQVDAREGMFIPMGGAKRADDVPAMLSVNEFVLNDDAVAGLGKLMTGSPDPRAGARALYRIQDQLEAMV